MNLYIPRQTQATLRKRAIYFTPPSSHNILITALQWLSRPMFSGVSRSFCPRLWPRCIVNSLPPASGPSCFYMFSVTALFLLLSAGFRLGPILPACLRLTPAQLEALYPAFSVPSLSFVCRTSSLFPLLFQLGFPVGGLQASFRNITGRDKLFCDSSLKIALTKLLAWYCCQQKSPERGLGGV